MHIIFLVHSISTFFMTGLCWFVQLVHYPLFRAINLAEFSSYERKNLFLTSYIAIPLMIVEGLSGLYLLYLHPDFLYFANIILFVVLALSTFLFQAPIHLKLLIHPNQKLITRLIRTNWIRTVSWSIRSCILIYVMTLIGG